MGKKVNAYKVDSLIKVDVTRYVEGDIFITNRSIGILVNNRIRTLSTGTPNLKDYVKKTDVEKMINNALEKVVKNNG